jgi:hypothetical protein
MKDQTMFDLGKKEPSPHEASSMGDLISPLQREVIKELCAFLKTKPETEAAAMFGEDVSFYQLSRRSARALAIALQNEAIKKLNEASKAEVTRFAWNMTFLQHNDPEHDKVACELCASHNRSER